jgi:hypothetical protein
LEWHQEDPNGLIIKYPDSPRQILRRGNAYLSDAAKPSHAYHPVIPKRSSKHLRIFTEKRPGQSGRSESQPPPESLDFPTVEDGVEGMALLPQQFKAPRLGAFGRKPSVKP